MKALWTTAGDLPVRIALDERAEKNATPPKAVGIWVRVSTEDQARGDSPEHHELRAQGYAASRGWQVVRVYRLEGVSGKRVSDHPETQKMLRDVKTGVIGGLIFSKLARLARNTKELLEFADFFRAERADLVSLEESIDTSTPHGRLFYTMIAAMAEWEREEIASRIAASVPIRAKLGKSTGGPAPFGYRFVEKRLVPDPEEAPVLRLMFELFREHRRVRTVARILHESGYRTRSGGVFTAPTVRRYLLDPVVKGTRKVNKVSSRGTAKPESDWFWVAVEPVVSEELWLSCQEILLPTTKEPRLPRSRKPVHVFAGYTVCGRCGGKMYVPSNTPKYVCRKCRTKIPIADLDLVFREELSRFVLSQDEVALYLGETNTQIAAKEELMRTLTQESERLRGEMDKVYELYLAEGLTPQGFAERYRPLEERREAIAREIPRLTGEIDALKITALSEAELVSEAGMLAERWPHLALEERRTIVETTLEQITVGKDEVELAFLTLPTLSEIPGTKRPGL